MQTTAAPRALDPEVAAILDGYDAMASFSNEVLNGGTSASTPSWGRWRSQSARLPTDEQLRQYELHTGGGVQPFAADELAACLPPECARRLRSLERYAFDPSNVGLCSRLPRSNLLPSHIALLLELGQIRRVAPCQGKAPATAFVVAEPKKERLRVLCWSAAANVAQEQWLRAAQRGENPEVPPSDVQIDLPGPADVARTAGCEEAVALLDLQAAFLQRQLPDAAIPAYVFSVGDSSYAPTRLCMGSTLSCHIMQAYTAAVAIAGIGDGLPWDIVEMIGLGRSMRSSSLPTGSSSSPVVVQIAVYVDNIRFAGAAWAVRRCFVAAKKRAKCYSVTLQDRDELISVPLQPLPQPFPSARAPPPPPYTFLGIRVSRRRTAPTRKLREAVVAAVLGLLETGEILLEAAVTLLGRLTWAGSVGGGDIRRHLDALLVLRRWANLAARGAPRETRCSLTRRGCVAVARLALDVLSWRDCAALSKVCREPEAAPRDPVIAYSDASRSGWGIVLLAPDGRSLSFGAKWPEGPAELPHINVLEAMALALAAKELTRAEKERGWLVPSVDFLIDSMVVVGVVSRGTSKCEKITRSVDIFRRRVEGRDWRVRHVPSAENLADAPSRGVTDCISSPAVPDLD